MRERERERSSVSNSVCVYMLVCGACKLITSTDPAVSRNINKLIIIIILLACQSQGIEKHTQFSIQETSRNVAYFCTSVNQDKFLIYI